MGGGGASRDCPHKCGKNVEKTHKKFIKNSKNAHITNNESTRITKCAKKVGNMKNFKRNENNIKIHNLTAQTRCRNLFATAIAFLLLCLFAFSSVLINEDANDKDVVKAFVDQKYYYISIMFEEDYGDPITGWKHIAGEYTSSSYKYAWGCLVQKWVLSTDDGNTYYECTLNFDALNNHLSTYGKKIKSLYAKDSSGNVERTITSSVVLKHDSFTYCQNIGSDHYGTGDAYAYPLYIEWETSTVAINYYDQGGAEFSGTHASGYATTHTNGSATTLDKPTKAGYVFGGWYLNDSTCSSASALVTSLSAGTTYTEISLYAKWTLAKCTLTLTCQDFSSQQYMIYIYKGDNIYMQFAPTKATETLTLAPVEDYATTPYKVCFVFGYLGNITFESLTNATASGRNVTLTTFADASITYTIATPNINSSIMI